MCAFKISVDDGVIIASSLAVLNEGAPVVAEDDEKPGAHIILCVWLCLDLRANDFFSFFVVSRDRDKQF